MKFVKFLATIDAVKCNGDRLCESICPTGAIRVEDKTAIVDANLCRACRKCFDVCRQGAVAMIQRQEPLVIEVDPETADEADIIALCEKAHLFPEQPICACTLTPTKEAAAAILKGARTPEELSAQTGVRTGCGIYCMGVIQRLLAAHGIELSPPANHRWYKLPLSVWDISDEVDRRHPGYHIADDKKLYTQK
jgi:Fe-S-cluster-containing hydrogenase component 2